MARSSTMPSGFRARVMRLTPYVVMGVATSVAPEWLPLPESGSASSDVSVVKIRQRRVSVRLVYAEEGCSNG